MNLYTCYKMSCPSINIQTMIQSKEVKIRKSYASSSKNKRTGNSPDVRGYVGKEFQIEVISFLRKNNLISQQQNSRLTKVSYQVQQKLLMDLKLIDQNDQQLTHLNTSTLQMLILNNQAEYDICPHIRNDKSYEEVMQMFKSHQKSSPINIYENIFGANIGDEKSKKILYAGEVKRNFFNSNEIMKLFHFPDQNYNGNQKISYYRTASIVRKICLVRRHEIEIVNESLNLAQRKFLQKNMRLRQMNKQQLINQTLEAITNIQEYPICFFLIIYAGPEMDGPNFLSKFSENEKNFLQKHCQHYKVTINLIVIVNQNQNQLVEKKMNDIKVLISVQMDQKFSDMAKNMQKNIDTKFSDMERNIDTKFSEMENKIQIMISDMLKQILSSKKQT